VVELANSITEQNITMQVLGLAPGVTSSIRLHLTNNLPAPIDVSVLRGTSFVPATAGYQTMVARKDLDFVLDAGPGVVTSVVIPTICGSQFGVSPPPVDGGVRYDTPGVSGAYVPFFETVDLLTDTFIPMAGSIGMPVDMFKESVVQYSVWTALDTWPLVTPGTKPWDIRTPAAYSNGTNTPAYPWQGGVPTDLFDDPVPPPKTFDTTQIYDILFPQLSGRGASDEQVNLIATTLWDGVDTTLKNVADNQPGAFDDLLDAANVAVPPVDFSGSNSAGVRTIERNAPPVEAPVVDERQMPVPGEAGTVIAQPDPDDWAAHMFGRSIAWDTLEHEAEHFDWVYDYEEFERIGYAISLLGQDGDIGQEAWNDIKAMLTPVTVFMIAASILVPPVAGVLLVKGFLDDAMLFADALNGIITADNAQDLDHAAKNFEKVIVKIGVGALIAILTIAGGKAVQAIKNKGASKGAGSAASEPAPTSEPLGNQPGSNPKAAPEPFELLPEGTWKGPKTPPPPEWILANGKARPPVNSKGVFVQAHPFTCAIAQIRTVLNNLGLKVPSEFAMYAKAAGFKAMKAKGLTMRSIKQLFDIQLHGTGYKAELKSVSLAELETLVNTPGTQVVTGIKTLSGGKHAVGIEGIKGGQMSIADSASGTSIQQSVSDFGAHHWLGGADGKAAVIVISK
jgi:hypothetical protein